VSMPSWKHFNPDLRVHYATEMEILTGAEAVVLMTEWSMYKYLDWPRLGEKMVQKLLIDGRNFLDKSELMDCGFKYIGVGIAEENPGLVDKPLKEFSDHSLTVANYEQVL
jgi:hypothetical protein